MRIQEEIWLRQRLKIEAFQHNNDILPEEFVADITPYGDKIGIMLLLLQLCRTFRVGKKCTESTRS